MMQIGNVISEKGKLTKGYLEIGWLNDGEPLRMPILIAEGMEEGEVFWVEGGIHGTETSGSLAIIELMHELDLTRLKGTVVGVPVVNILAHRYNQRTSPVDGGNLNRVFPGSAAGGYTHQLAAGYFDMMSRHANYVLDFHNGGLTMDSPFYCGDIEKADDPTSDKTRRMLSYTGADAGWLGFYEEFHDKLPSQMANLAKNGIPSLIVESGGGNVTAKDIANYKQSVFGCLKGFGFMEGEPPINPHQIRLVNGSTPTAPTTRRGGIFLLETHAGAILKKGESVGRIVNLFGETLEELVALEDDLYVNAVLNHCTPVNSGEMYGEFSKVLR